MVAIRNWQIEDAFAFHKLSMDPYFASRRLKQYLYPDTFLNTVTILETYRDADKEKFRIYAVTIDDHVCGYIQFERKDTYCGEISYWIGRSYWNQGIATQAVQLMCRKIFQEFPIYRMYARVKELNIASSKVLLHNGFQCVQKDGSVHLYERYR